MILEMTTNKTRKLLVGRFVLLAALMACTAGCHSSDETSSTPPPQPAAQSQADAIQKVKDNPNVPPDAKANIIAHMQGTTPPTTPAAPR